VSAVSAGPAAGADRRTLLARVGLGLVAAGNAEVGIWGVVAPRSFYDNYPGFGRHWVAALGQYNEHLVRDYAAAELGFAVLLAIAAWWFGRRAVLAAGAAFLAGTLPHFAYHLTTTESFKTADNVASLAAFALEMAVIAVAMLVAVQTPDT
jgi:hypothetical protein